MQGADFSYAQMQGADFSYAQMQGADLLWVQMQGVDLSGAGLQGADLSDAQMQGADLGGAQMQGADLLSVQGVDLSGAILGSTGVQGALIDTIMHVFGGNQDELFDDKTYWCEIEKLADSIPDASKRQHYLQSIQQAQQANQLNQAKPFLLYQPQAIAESALSAICNAEDGMDRILPKESRLSSALAFRNRYLNLSDDLKKNPDYPKLMQDIDYQLCTLPECQDIRGDIKGLDCAKSKPPEW